MTQYGTTGYGNIFSIDTGGLFYKDLFDFNDTLGAYPLGDLTVAGNIMYGMTSSGGESRFGNVFSIDTSGHGFTAILSFNGANGEDPQGDLILSGNLLYGMAYGGGTDSAGVIFKVDTTPVTAINEVTPNMWETNLYPNPNSGQFTLSLINPGIVLEMQQQVKIYNLLGETVYQSFLTAGNSQIKLPDPVSGIYLFRIVTPEGKSLGAGKFVVE